MLFVLIFFASAIEYKLSDCIHKLYEREVLKVAERENSMISNSEFVHTMQFWLSSKKGIILYGLHVRYGTLLALVSLILSNVFSFLVKHDWK